MAVTPYAPCGWTPTAIPGSPCCSDLTDPAIVDQANTIAAAVIWGLTGRQFGCCSMTVRPCKPKTCDPITLSQLIYWDSRAYLQFGAPNLGVLSFFPTLIDGQVYNIQCGCPTGCCTCEADCEVSLPGPICAVANVTVDGVVLDPSLYRVVDGRKLIFNHVLVGNASYAADIVQENALGTLEATMPDRVGTPVPFVPDLATEAKYASYCPPCQDFNLANGQIGTWSVTYSVGVPVPNEANFAAGLYAQEVAKALLNDTTCALPERVAAITRQGVTTAFWDPTKLVENGLTGLKIVDQIIKLLNPNQLTQPARVWFPGRSNAVRRDAP